MDTSADREALIAYFSAAIDTSEDAVVSLDLEGRVALCNRAAQRLFGRTEADVRDARVADLLAGSEHGAWQRTFGLALAGQPVEHGQLSVRSADGAPVPTRFTAAPVRAGDGRVLGVSLVLRDVAEERLAQATLADNAQRVAESEALAHVGSWAWDATAGTVQWSAEQHRIHGVAPGDFDGTLTAQLQRVHHVDRPAVGRALWQSLRTGAAFDREFRLVRPDSSLRWVNARATLVVGPGGEGLGLRGIYHDITERHENAFVLQEANERLTRLALYDRLTGLPNRVMLVDRLGHSLTRGREFGARVDLMYLGIDDFQTINDSAGHSAGDQVLTALAPVLGQAVRIVGLPRRSPGRMLARLGGDEFAIVLDDGDPAVMAEAIHEVLQQPLHLPDDQLFISVSIGNAQGVSSRRDATAEDLITEANIAMHEAKRGGKGLFVSFEPRMHEVARSRHQLGHELRRALAEGQFVLHYQPIVDLGSAAVIGAEALVRWEHPVRGLVGPDDFISRAEETGLIVPLGAWVLRQACTEAVRLHQDTGCPLTVAVNVSGRQLREADFVETVRSALRESGLPAALLCLEITESVLMENDEAGLAMLTRLRADGVHLAIDDFGTGYSSLAALRRLPVDELKIDQSFVAELPDDDDASTIAWAIVHLGQALGLRVLAEGVETTSQRAALLQFGCDRGQGYLFGRAVPVDALGALIAGPPSRSAGRATGVPTPRAAHPVAQRPRR